MTLLGFLVGFCILFHLAAAYKEMITWRKTATKLVGFDAGQADDTWMLGFNQGVYNLFIAAGLGLSFCTWWGEEASTLLRVFLLW